MGLRHEHKLASIAWVGQNLLVPISWQGETKMSREHFKIPYYSDAPVNFLTKKKKTSHTRTRKVADTYPVKEVLNTTSPT